MSAFLFLMSYAHKTMAKKGKVGVEVLVQYIAYWVGIVILMFGIDKVANILLGVEKKRLSETSGKHLNRWGKAISVLGLIIMLWFSGKSNSDVLRILYGMVYIALFLGFQMIMEFIYIKKSKQYISTIILLILVLMILIIFIIPKM